MLRRLARVLSFALVLGLASGFASGFAPAAALAACGDGVLDAPGEQCDDGGTADGDCCASNCVFESYGAHCDDGLFCTIIDGCSSGLCLGLARTCDDDDACTIDSCDENTDSCVNREEPRPADECFVAGKASFQVSDAADPADDRLSWKWSKGNGYDQDAVGTPTTSTSFALCVYQSEADVFSLVASALVAPSSVLWTEKSPKGASYKDSAGASSGVTGMTIKTGAVGKTSVKLQARGASLVLPGAAGATYFTQGPAVAVQLVNDVGSCWTSGFGADQTKKNDAGGFKASAK